jgi:hypothetical protein
VPREVLESAEGEDAGVLRGHVEHYQPGVHHHWPRPSHSSRVRFPSVAHRPGSAGTVADDPERGDGGEFERRPRGRLDPGLGVEGRPSAKSRPGDFSPAMRRHGRGHGRAFPDDDRKPGRPRGPTTLAVSPDRLEVASSTACGDVLEGGQVAHQLTLAGGSGNATRAAGPAAQRSHRRLRQHAVRPAGRRADEGGATQRSGKRSSVDLATAELPQGGDPSQDVAAVLASRVLSPHNVRKSSNVRSTPGSPASQVRPSRSCQCFVP